MLKHMLNTNGGPGVVGRPQQQQSPPPDAAMVMMTDMHRSAGGRGGAPLPNSSFNPNLSMNLSQRHALNISTLSTSKHSLGNSSSVSPGGGNGSGGSNAAPVLNGPVPQILSVPQSPKLANGGLHISRGRATSLSAGSVLIPANVSKFMNKSKEAGIKEMLTSLGLLCLVSLLLALLSLIFLLKISPLTATDVRDLLRSEQLTVISAEEYVVVYEVTLALCALTLSLNLCCLLVCAIQFLFAVKLVKSLQGGGRRFCYCIYSSPMASLVLSDCSQLTSDGFEKLPDQIMTNKYLQKSSITRVCAVGGFFVSIPVFLTGIILYTFIQFHSTPAIVTSVLIGLGIIFCGCAMVHNVFVWQREKTNAVKAMAQQQAQHQQQQQQQQQQQAQQSLHHHLHQQLQHSLRHPTPPTPSDPTKQPPCHPRDASGSVSPGMPAAMLDLSSVTTNTSPHELSTLV
uniref:Uncharacterized protein n=1 Tax=Timema monikensis TaxID=170555 RepID=A0A7R9EDB1_9NEOP|nr:unnamed protein product [Timema monikensis]